MGESDQIQFWTDTRSDKVEDIEHCAWGEVFGMAVNQVLNGWKRYSDTRSAVMPVCADVLVFWGQLATISSGGNSKCDQSRRERCLQSEGGCMHVWVIKRSGRIE